MNSEQDRLKQQLDELRRENQRIHQQLRFSQQFFETHAVEQKVRLRAADGSRLQALRYDPTYARAFTGEAKISIIVPTYNRAELLIERTIPSVLVQTYNNWELIIVGDQMSAEQAAALTKAASGDSRIRFHNLKRRGRYPELDGPRWYVAGTKPVNFGLRIAQGQWIAHLDDDDQFLPDHLAALLHCAQRERAEWVHAKVLFRTDDGQDQCVVGGEHPIQGGISRISSLYHAGLKTFRYNPNCWRYCVPGDWDLWERFLSMGVRYAHLDTTTAIHFGDYFGAVSRPGESTDEASRPSPASSVVSPVAEWLGKRGPTENELGRIGDYLAAHDGGPVFGVFVLDADGQLEKVQKTLVSLRQCLYESLRMTVLTPAKTPYTEADGKLHFIRLNDQNVSTQLNEAMQQSGLEWLMVVDAGDEFTRSGLMIAALELIASPGCRAIYGDEMLRLADGSLGPMFRPGFNLDLLLSFPASMARHWLFRRDAFVELGGFDQRYGSAMELDLILRLVESAGMQDLGHVSEPLLITRAPALLDNPDERASIARHLAARDYQQAQVGSDLPGRYHINYGHAQRPLVSILIPTKDQLPMLQRCVESVLEHTRYEHYEILIIDNNSETPEAREWLAGVEAMADEQVRVLRYPHPFNFSAINNMAARAARGEYLVLLNNDTAAIRNDWLDELLNHAQRPEVGIVGAKLLYPDGRIQHAGVVLGLCGPADHPFIGEALDAPGYMQRLQVDQNYSAVTAACLMIRKSVYLEVGGMDEERFKVSYNDVDLCLKTREVGYLTVWTPRAVLLHEGSVSQTKVDKQAAEAKHKRFAAEQDAMYAKWLPILARDPAYNPNFSLVESGGFKLADSKLSWRPLDAWRPLPVILAHPADLFGCGHYRVMQPFKAQQEAGLIDGALSMGMLQVSDLERYDPDVVILQRQIGDERLQAIRRMQTFSRAFKVYELDDYLPNLPMKSAYRPHMPKDILKSLRRGLSYVDRFVVSTEALAEAFAGLHEDIRVIENRLPVQWWQGVQAQRRTSARARVGWAGGAGHAGDLEMIADVVKELAGEVDWVFFGLCPDKLRPYIHEFHPAVSIERYPAALAGLNLDLALAPVEQNLFNECKSNLRLLEYGACGFPVICSDVRCYQGVLPVTRVKNRFKDWLDAIRLHLTDLDATARMGDELRAAVSREWMLEGQALESWRKVWLPD
jgi:GT2 family glycosyltransferase